MNPGKPPPRPEPRRECPCCGTHVYLVVSEPGRVRCPCCTTETLESNCREAP